MDSVNIRCNREAKERLVILVARKYGKVRGVLGKELELAIENHCNELEQELKDDQ